MNNVPRMHGMLSLEQALGAAPSLAALQEQIQTSQRLLKQVEHLIPTNLRLQVKAGPIQDNTWCLMVGSAAVSTKLRQLLPVLLQALSQRGEPVETIRIKVQMPSP